MARAEVNSGYVEPPAPQDAGERARDARLAAAAAAPPPAVIGPDPFEADQAPYVPPPSYVPPAPVAVAPASPPHDRPPPTPTWRELLAPEFIRGNERMGSGAMRVTPTPPPEPHYQVLTPQEFQRLGDSSSLRARARQHALDAGIDPDIFERQIEAESGFNVAPSGRDAQGRPIANAAGARGIAQIVSQWHPDVDPDDPEAALAYAARLMSSHLRNYGGDYAKALAAYNAGPGAVASGAAFTYPETQGYIAKILRGGGSKPSAAQAGVPAAPEQVWAAAFPDRFEDSPLLDEPVPVAPPRDPSVNAAQQHRVGEARGPETPAEYQRRVMEEAGRGAATITPETPVLGGIMAGLEGAAMFARAGAAIPHIIADEGVRARFDSLATQIAARTGRDLSDPFVRMAAGSMVEDERPNAFTIPLRDVVAAIPFAGAASRLIPSEILVGEKGLSEMLADPFNVVGGIGFEKAVLQAIGKGAAQVPRAAWWAVEAAERSVIGRETAGLGAGYFAKYAPEPITAARLAKKRERELLGLGPTDPTASEVAADLRRFADANNDPVLRAQYLGPDRGIKRSPTIARGQGQSEVPTRTGARPNIVGMGVSRTTEAQAYEVANVTRFRQAADEMDALSDRIKQIENDPALEWGSLAPEQQILRRVIDHPDEGWESFLSAYRTAQNEGDAARQADIIAKARAHGEWLERQRAVGGVPFGNPPPLVGDGAEAVVALRSEQAVLAVKLDDLRKQGIVMRDTAQLVEDVPQLYTVRQKVVNGVLSKKRYELLDPEGRVFATVSGKTTAQRRAGELNLATANTQLPGTPKPTTPDLVLQNPEVSDAAARSTRVEGEQQTLGDAPVADLEARTRPRIAEPGQGAAILPDELAPTIERLARDYAVPQKGAPDGFRIMSKDDGRKVIAAYDNDGNLVGVLTTKADGPQVVAVREDARRKGIATRLYDTAAESGIDVTTNIGRGGRTQAGLDFTEAYRKKRIAELSGAFAVDPAMEAKLAQPRINAPTAAQAAEAAAPIPGERFVFRDGVIFDTQLNKVDDILTARVPESASKPGTKSSTGGERWAKWANKKVTGGEWREHQAAVPPGQKLVPAAAQVVEEGQKVVPEAAVIAPPGQPPRPPRKRAGVGDEGDEHIQRDVDLEGPNPVIWRVVDNADGSASLGRLDLDRGMTISGEKFTDREGALITAEARNATEEAVTMIEDTMDDLRRALSDQPPMLALPSPGMSAARRKASQAEATYLEKERAAATAEVEKARADYRRRLANDPGFGVTNPGLVPPKKVPKGTTPIPLRGREVAPSPIAEAPETAPFQTAGDGGGVQGRMFDTPGESARRAARDLLGGIPVGFSGASRALGTMADIGTAFRQLGMFAVKHPRSWARAMVEGGIGGYLNPKVATQRAHDVFVEVMEEGGRALHFRGGEEFTGEAVKVPDIILKNPLVERSNASFNSSINLANGRVFLGIVRNDAKQAAKSGRAAMSQEDKDALAWVLNHQTGYGYDPTKLGDVGQFFHKATSMLYSTQWQASRFGVYGDLKTAIKNLATGNLRAADKEALSGGIMFAASNVAIVATIANVMGVEIDFRANSTNFMQVPIGDSGTPDMGAKAAALSVIGVGVQTRADGSVWADFSSGLGADVRLLGKLFPFGGDGEGIITGKSVGGSGYESDPYNPGFGDRNALGIVIDWMTSRGDPRTRLATSFIDRFGGDDMTADESLLSALISSVIPMLVQDAGDAAGLTENLRVESFMEQLESVPSWFTGTAAPTPSAAPGVPVPAGGGSLRGKYGSP